MGGRARTGAHSDWVRDVRGLQVLDSRRAISPAVPRQASDIMDEYNGLTGQFYWSYKYCHTFDDVVWHVSWSIMATFGHLAAITSQSLKENFPTATGVCISDMTAIKNN